MSDRSNEYFIDNDIVRMCEHFADMVVSSNLDCYKKRKQFNQDKIKNDILIGKIAEWGVFFVYLNRGIANIGFPDMQIYPTEDKSFDCDLSCGSYKLHIKSQTYQSAHRYGDSWIFQIKDPLFEYSNEYDIVIGCRVTFGTEGAFVQIMLEKCFNDLKFGDTKMLKFPGDKKAIYQKENNE